MANLDGTQITKLVIPEGEVASISIDGVVVGTGIKRFTINFYNGATLVETKMVAEGSKLTTLPSVSKTGYNYAGYTASSGGTLITVDTIPTEDTNYYIQFTPITYYI